MMKLEVVLLFIIIDHLCAAQVYNKVDQISIEEVDRLARKPNSVVIRSDACVSPRFADAVSV